MGLRRTLKRFFLNGIKKPAPHVINPKIPPRGAILYRNSNAAPVQRVRDVQGKKIPFGMTNVEWIRIRHGENNELGHGAYGTVSRGKAKFKGAKAQEIAIKSYHRAQGEMGLSHLNSVIERIQQSAVHAPKMVAFVAWDKILRENRVYVAMELYATKGKTSEGQNQVFSKLKKPIWRVLESSTLLSDPWHAKAFQQFALDTARLAKVNLALGEVYHRNRETAEKGPEGNPRIDEFSVFTKKNGDPAVVLHDIDCMEITSSSQEAWEHSVRMIKKILVHNHSARDYALLSGILRRAGEEHGFKE